MGPEKSQSDMSLEQVPQKPSKKKLSKRTFWIIMISGLAVVLLPMMIYAIITVVKTVNSQQYADAVSKLEAVDKSYDAYSQYETQFTFLKIQNRTINEASRERIRKLADELTVKDDELMKITETLPAANVKKARQNYIEMQKKEISKSDKPFVQHMEEQFFEMDLVARCFAPIKKELNFLHRDGSYQRILTIIDTCDKTISLFKASDRVDADSKKATGDIQKLVDKYRQAAEQKKSESEFENIAKELQSSQKKSSDTKTEKTENEKYELEFFQAIIDLKNALNENISNHYKSSQQDTTGIKL